MDLFTAHDLMKTDNAKWFKGAYEHAGKDGSSSLEEYVEEVCADPEAWVKSLPGNIKARSTLTKPKTALMSLTTLETSLTEAHKTDLKAKLDRVYKNKAFIESVIRERSPNDPDASSVDLDDGAKVAELQRQVEVLKKALLACCKNTDFGDTVCILVDSLVTDV